MILLLISYFTLVNQKQVLIALTNSIKYLLLSIAVLFMSVDAAHATHNRAGEINYQQIDNLTIRATIITYTKTSSTDADRDSLEIQWGDGTKEFVLRSNDQGDPIDNDIKVNYYIAEHTYPNQGTYTIYLQDPNRVANILNVNFPNSVNVPFYLETTFTFLNTEFQGFNNSAVLLQPPIDFACTNQVFKHNPNAYDQDGDSLAFELAVPGQDIGIEVPDYSYPDEIAPGIENMLSINPVTGEMVWRTPKLQGEYNIAIRVKEYRQGNLISSMIRDMQIFVIACDNRPPEISAISEICVIAGESIDIPVRVNDPDDGQLVKLDASGGPFFIRNQPAELTVNEDFSEPELIGNFRWNTNCNHVSEQYYQVVFRAIDNSLDDTGLADLHTLRIKVVAPPPADPKAESFSDRIQVSWELPYDCEFTNEDFFKGFSVWRKIGSQTLPVDTCANGLEGTEYEKIVFLTDNNDGERYSIFDENVEKGTTYCYRILAEFASETASGNIFNRVASLPSDEVCMQIARDLPLITNVSITATDESDGQAFIRWTKPLVNDLDTIENPAPYRYQLLRSIAGADNYEEITDANWIINSFNEAVDTTYEDNTLNTLTQDYDYRVDFYSSNLESAFGSSKAARSVFLAANGSDRRIELSWAFDVPWDNVSFEVQRFDDMQSAFVTIGTTTERSFTDFGLDNDQSYCYQILAIGTYGISGIIDPLENYSQELCSTPVDNEGPCPPTLVGSNTCTNPDDFANDESFENRLSWTMPNVVCSDIDLAGYVLYFSSTIDSDQQEIIRLDGINNNRYTDLRETSVFGCYTVSAFDINGNEGAQSNVICLDNCPIYELGNAFTPNGDQSNDLFVPRKNRFISSIKMNIFNQWGNRVFETNDPEINWDGTNTKGNDLAEGVYYYSCEVYSLNSTVGLEQAQVLNGFIHLIRN